MQFHPGLQRATLLRRYKRFLADVETDNGEKLTIHCPNTGAMTGCAEPGSTVWYSTSANAKRKYPNTWEISETREGHKIVVNTQRANQVAEEALMANAIPALEGYRNIQREVRYGAEKSRIDLLLSQHPAQADCYIEVKSVTLSEAEHGFFPDAVTLRGQKHIRELMAMVSAGQRAALLFIVGHSAIQSVKPAAHIDPAYAQLCIQAKRAGVEFYALSVNITAQRLTPGKLLKVHIS